MLRDSYIQLVYEQNGCFLENNLSGKLAVLNHLCTGVA